ncbi:hypothetical protein BM1374165_01176 [Bartonella henselae]|uniref:Uncharacterized protein n=1 Tax=Bartonella henselae TaxID=38323 RepID=X5M5A6_BARHN|nr:hypothetical protein BM1374165_01176 [Bartonella henselae]
MVFIPRRYSAVLRAFWEVIPVYGAFYDYGVASMRA